MATSDWRLRYKDFKDNMYKKKEPKEMLNDFATPHDTEAGILGINGGGVFVRGDQSIDIFAKEGLGLKIDPASNSITLYCSKFNVYSNTSDFYTDIMGLKWNKFPLNLKPQFFGSAGPVPVVVEGSILPFNTAAVDAEKYIEKTIGQMTNSSISLGGLTNV